MYPGVEAASGGLQPRERHSENFGRILSLGGITMKSHPLFVNDRSSLPSSPSLLQPRLIISNKMIWKSQVLYKRFPQR